VPRRFVGLLWQRVVLFDRQLHEHQPAEGHHRCVSSEHVAAKDVLALLYRLATGAEALKKRAEASFKKEERAHLPPLLPLWNPVDVRPPGRGNRHRTKGVPWGCSSICSNEPYNQEMLYQLTHEALISAWSTRAPVAPALNVQPPLFRPLATAEP
jgi:hypothetical protein